jgi:predicted transcriptional regulator of viral defense system
MSPYKELARRLYELASAQGGYFTTKQAQAAGYAASTHSYNVNAGNWIREHRGIYRMANYPNPERPDLIVWSLWSSNRKGEPQGVYSHQTALSIYDLSDINPPKLHMTVPRGFRRSSPTPRILVLHLASLGKWEVEAMHGFQVTRPLRTIADLLAEGSVSMDYIQQAVKEAFQRGIITHAELGSSTTSGDLKRRIEQLRGQ